MNTLLTRVLHGQQDNHIMPFFWVRGEDEATLRRTMQAIYEANIRAVCVESRPHPDYCGPRWWRDMDIILDEARTRGMQVWILDDSHFPTGHANGAMKDAPLELHRQSLCHNTIDLTGDEADVTLRLTGLIPPPFTPSSQMEEENMPYLLKGIPRFEDDQVIALTAVCADSGEVNYIPYNGQESLTWHKPAGRWRVYVIGLSRNMGVHRKYINMLDPDSCRILLDAVYEPHYAHYAADFGATIAGFFSDEPELGNGHLYYFENPLGTDQDLPFARTMPPALRARLGDDWANQMYLLWHNQADPQKTAFVRQMFMDAVTDLVRTSFSRQIGDWCRAHHVQYIGHTLEDDNSHARTGPSLGHIFRGLDGQDMGGIDCIGVQVGPQWENDEPLHRGGTFFHFQLGNLAASAAAIQPAKHHNAMVEIFGNYGWMEGVRLQKYLADHFMVRGLNYFVPHAFSAAPFPDGDCPPHFYAHGHDPLYRHFGWIINYMNRVSTLMTGGHMVVNTAVIYHADAEWTGDAMLSQEPVRALVEHQISCHTIPCDVFSEAEYYHTAIGSALTVNDNTYTSLVVPRSQFLPKAAIMGMAQLIDAGCRVVFIDSLPQGMSDSAEPLPESICKATVAHVTDLPGLIAPEITCAPHSSYLRAAHYVGDAELYYFVNEGAEPWTGHIDLPQGDYVQYDPWENKLYPARVTANGMDTAILPLKSLILVVGTASQDMLSQPVTLTGQKEALTQFTRSVCDATEYPAFHSPADVTLPDALANEMPDFSGLIRYDTAFAARDGERMSLEITDAYEGVQVFLNGQDMGIQAAPPFIYDLTDALQPGSNALRIEVATTLERQVYALHNHQGTPPTSLSGITGTVYLYRT